MEQEPKIRDRYTYNEVSVSEDWNLVTIESKVSIKSFKKAHFSIDLTTMECSFEQAEIIIFSTEKDNSFMWVMKENFPVWINSIQGDEIGMIKYRVLTPET